MRTNEFVRGFAVLLVLLGGLTLGLQFFLTRVGEIDLGAVVDRQFAAGGDSILFASGIDQQAYEYKMLMLDRVKPDIFVLGSSRAMQVRENFFTGRFVNLGGAAQNVAGLELVADHLAKAGQHSRLAMVFVDPWWFNARNAPSLAAADSPAPFPKIVSAGLVWQAALNLEHGDWIHDAMTSSNLGIYALITNAGFSRDGGYNYLSTIAGTLPESDAAFADTLGRIAGDRDMFQKNSHPDPALVARACTALRAISRSADHVVLIAPPFPHAVWQRMMQGGYGYIAEAYAGLAGCDGGLALYDFSNPESLIGAVDCEFFDGVHGGNTIAARMLQAVGDRDPVARANLKTDFMASFIKRYAGFAGGITLFSHPELREVDFLHLGCRKSVDA